MALGSAMLCALHLEMLAGFQQNTNHRENTSMSSMAPVYRGEDFGKQIYTMHSINTRTQTSNQQVACDRKRIWRQGSTTAGP